MKTKKAVLVLFALLSSVIMPPPASAVTPRILGPEMKIINNNIIVETSIADTTDLEQTIKSGVGKEIVFTAELIRVWRFWPDEFVVSKKISKVIKYDNLRDQYRLSSYDGTTRSENKFNDFTSLKDRIFTADAVNLANIRELEPSHYYIRVVVESKSMTQLPFIGFLMHLVPEVEMSLAKESRPFAVGSADK